ncbi:MAG: PASTA domain-containing protein [Bacteroidetes bacterium]|nr:MAG: PASTA domain-containing protein [Bacteroidota bacterium]
MSFFKFLFSKYFVINLIIAALLTTALVFGVLKYIEKYTLHNQSVTVPDFRGMHKSEVFQFAEEHQLIAIINDSVYNFEEPKGVVLDQNPMPEKQVKQGRKIYLTINATQPPKVAVPNLKDLSLRQATAILESYGLKIGELQYKPDPCVNCVLEMKIGDQTIEPKTMIEKGKTIDLVLGAGTSNEVIPLPFLLNLTFEEAKLLLNSKGLNIGHPVYEDCATKEDSAKAKIFKQIPPYDSKAVINLGKTVNVFLTCDSIKVLNFLPDSIPASKDSLETGF